MSMPHSAIGSKSFQKLEKFWLPLRGIFSAFAQTNDRRVVPEASETYDEWRGLFTWERLKVLYLLGLTANLVFIAADLLLYAEYFHKLLQIRAVLEIGLFCCYLLVRFRPSAVSPNVFLALWVLIGNLCIVQMTVLLGGFTAQYYNGLNLVFLAAAVIVPVSWPTHLFAQAGTLLAYYGINFLTLTTPADLNAAMENSFFLVWTCVALLFSISFYERLQRAEFQARIQEQQAKKDLEASNQKLLELDRLKSEFFANISHEIRTPLTLNIGAFKTLLKSALNADAQEVSQAGLRNASRLLFLINELLDLAKFDTGRATPHMRCIDLAGLVRGVVTNFDSSPHRRIHLKGLTDPVPVEADPRQMKKVFYNLLSNAFKFSDPDEGQVWIRLNRREDSIELEVEDNGIGIPSNQIERIFDRFTQVEGSATRRYEGSGIGLALVKEIITLHRGTIAVESEVGQGSIFTMTLPRGNITAAPGNEVQDDEDDLSLYPGISFLPSTDDPKASDFLETSPSPHGAPVVLVVDDSADMRSYIARILHKHYRVVLAKDGVEALATAQRVGPELIVTDVMMPHMSGHDLLNAIRHDPTLHSIPVVFLTARAGTEARIESLEAGADDYLSKPFDEAELSARVGNLLRARAQEREIRQLQKEKLGRFLPANLADLIMSGEHEHFLQGHRREITVLFIDLRGFTAFVEITAPEDVMSILREFRTVMGRLISEYKGTLERFVGDGMMVYFNDPLPCPDHAHQAVRLALAIRQAASSLGEEWKKRGVQLGAGIGLETGYATIGAIGFKGREDYTAIGKVTNLAARLCSEAQHGQILISARLVSLIENLVVVEPIGEMRLKGIQKPVEVFQVVSLKS